MTSACDYSTVSDAPCWGAVTLVEDTDMATGDRMSLQACEGHWGITVQGRYVEQGVAPDDTVEVPVTSWDAVPPSFFTDDL